MTSDDDYLLNEWESRREANPKIKAMQLKSNAIMLEISLVEIKALAIELAIAKETMEYLKDWHACNVIDEAIRTTGKAVKLIEGKMEELKNDGQY